MLDLPGDVAASAPIAGVRTRYATRLRWRQSSGAVARHESERGGTFWWWFKTTEMSTRHVNRSRTDPRRAAGSPPACADPRRRQRPPLRSGPVPGRRAGAAVDTSSGSTRTAINPANPPLDVELPTGNSGQTAPCLQQRARGARPRHVWSMIDEHSTRVVL